jgi:hypothetical protein
MSVAVRRIAEDMSVSTRLSVAADLREAAERNLERFVILAAQSMTWREIGEVIGVSTQAAHARYARLQLGDSEQDRKIRSEVILDEVLRA